MLSKIPRILAVLAALPLLLGQASDGTGQQDEIDLSPALPTAGVEPLYYTTALSENFERGDSVFFEGEVGERRFFRTSGHYQIDARNSSIAATSVVPAQLQIYRTSARFQTVTRSNGEGSGPLYGLVLNYREDRRDSFSYYLFATDGAGSAYLIETSSGEPEQIASASYPAAESDWTELTAEVVRGELTLSVNGEQVLDEYDNSLPSGGVGFYTRGESAVNVDDFRLSHPVFRAESFRQDFSDRSQVRERWFLGRAAGAVFKLREQTYRIDSTGAEDPAVAMLDGAATDFSATAQFTHLDGDPSRGFGIFFRARPDEQGRMSYHRVLVNDLQGVTLQAHTPQGDERLWGWNTTEAYQSQESNRLRVSVTGKEVRISVNGERVAEVTLESEPEPGQLGILVSPETAVAVEEFRLNVNDPAVGTPAPESAESGTPEGDENSGGE